MAFFFKASARTLARGQFEKLMHFKIQTHFKSQILKQLGLKFTFKTFFYCRNSPSNAIDVMFFTEFRSSVIWAKWYIFTKFSWLKILRCFWAEVRGRSFILIVSIFENRLFEGECTPLNTPKPRSAIPALFMKFGRLAIPPYNGEPTHYESGDIALHYKSLFQDEIFRRIRHSDTNWG